MTVKLQWCSTAAEAFYSAVDAQPASSPWRRLLGQATRHRQAPAPAVPPATGPGIAVVAGIVLSLPVAHAAAEAAAGESQRQYCCVSLGSGTRCVGVRCGEDGAAPSWTEALALQDGHAEVMAARGFTAAVLSWVGDAALQLRGRAVLQQTTNGGFSFAENVEATLVCTHWPCGSMARAATGETGGRLLLGTPLATLLGWRVAGDDDGGDVVSVAGHLLATHRSAADVDARFRDACRLKPGKGPSNLSMSCSDAVWRWTVRGLLPPAAQSLLDGPPLRLSEVVVGCTAAPTGCADDGRAEAAASLRAKTLCLISGVAAVGGLSPRVGIFTLRSDDDSCARDGADFIDSGLSRAVWVVTSSSASGASGAMETRKRRREDDGEGDRLTFASAALNMKAGLPHGLPLRTVERRMERAEDVVHLFPLSNAWLRGRVAALRGRGTYLPPTPCAGAAPMAQWLRQAQGGEAGRPAQPLLWVALHSTAEWDD